MIERQLGCPDLKLARRLGRREFLRVGGLGLLGLNLPTLLQARSQTALGGLVHDRDIASSFGRAKACILLFMWGGPAQQETWDLKPDAPENIRGEFRPIETRVPGILISEHFPLLADRADRLAIVRSVHHADVNHTTATHDLLTGRPIARPGGGPRLDDWPHIGAVMNHLGRGGDRTALPPFIQMMPTSTDGAPRFVEESHGQGAGWLGPALEPFSIDQDLNRENLGATGAFHLPDDLAPGRIDARNRLLLAIERQVSAWERSGHVRAQGQYHARAHKLLANPRTLEAFDLEREDPRLRDRYGRNSHGQAVLQARRLVEAGVPIVTVFWANDGITNVSVYWDTHNRNFIDLKTRLMPPADRAFSALLDDLDSRGLLEETLVVWTGEFGRTPRVGQSVVGGAGAGRDGRDHWPHCFSTVMAGAGIRGGTVHGASDRWAAYPSRDPVRPADLVATIYHCLGVDPQLELRDPLGRPLQLCLGDPVRGIIR
jgi:Protein of unknown function (DUF1501)